MATAALCHSFHFRRREGRMQVEERTRGERGGGGEVKVLMEEDGENKKEVDEGKERE